MVFHIDYLHDCRKVVDNIDKLLNLDVPYSFIIVSNRTLYIAVREMVDKMLARHFSMGNKVEVLVVPEITNSNYDPDWVFSSVKWLKQLNPRMILFCISENLTVDILSSFYHQATEHYKAGCLFVSTNTLFDFMLIRGNVFFDEYEEGKSLEYLAHKLTTIGYKNYQINMEENQ